MLRHPFHGTPILTNGYRGDKKRWGSNLHFGEDYALEKRVGIIAVDDGKVIETKGVEKRQWLANTPTDPFKPRFGYRSLRTEDYGNYIKVDHNNGYTTLYAHLDEVTVSNGMNVEKGQLIGYADSTGNSSGNHIHWEVRKNNIVVDMNSFDYSAFNGKGGEQNKFYVKSTVVRVLGDDGLYVRSGPSRSYKLAGSKILKQGSEVPVKGFVVGEDILGNSLWWESSLGNYFWSGGTDNVPSIEDLPPTIVDLNKKKFMTLEEKESKKAELAAKVKEHEEAVAALKVEMEVLEAEAVAEVTIVESVVETPVEPVTETVVEPVVEPVVEAPVVEEPVVEAPAEDVKAEVSKLEALLAELKAKMGM